MSLRVVLFTRSSRPSGAQMAWRLFQSGMKPVAIIVEKRSRMFPPILNSLPQRGRGRGEGGGKKKGVVAIFFRFGMRFLLRKLWETIHIRSRYFWRRLLRERFRDPRYLSIEEWALGHPSVRVYEVDDHNSLETQELLWRLESDVGILTNTRRIEKSILEMPRYGFLNLHLSALPQYAGLDSIFWALYHGEKQIGVTVHLASDQIDRGDIVLQKKIPANFLEDEESVYQKALWLGTALMVEALKELEAGTLKRIPQDSTKASYFSWPTCHDRKSLRARQRRAKQSGLSHPEARRAEGSRDPSAPPQDDGRRKLHNDKVRVLHLITRMTRGGAQENTLATVLGLRQKGYEVTLITGPSWGKEGEILSQALKEGLDVTIFPELVREIHPWKDVICLAKLSSWLVKNRYDIIHTHSSKAGFLGRLAARLARIPVLVHTPHGHVFHSYFHPWKEKLFLSLERKAAKWADRLIALTNRCREEHLQLGVGNPEKWVTIPSGVNENDFREAAGPKEEILVRFKVASNQRIIGFVGRLAPVKGARYLVEALPQIFEFAPDSHCFIVGDGEERPGLQRRVAELGLNGRVTFTGHQEKVAEWMSLFDVLVVPSLNEGMGRVIAEGGLLRKAVVGTRVGGIPDLIEDGQTGFLIEPRNPNEIVSVVTELLQDSALSERLGRRLQEKVLDGFTEHQMIAKIHCLYQELLTEKGIGVSPEAVLCP